ncbi:MOSC domain-containing protein [Rhizobium sp. BK251]|uniref:MOSC domain-containing protein n=1 Tax=Rhizobium sp. BK251 TaxID=2512125 RepID=UPI00104D037A|nr:MOSC domain-containing protein [Rhizobium sp. BK251]TCL71906.1 MOSC domain-containing protein YiiM [Rhizobium sp. BK251]
MKILSVCLGRPERLRGRQYKTGIYKHPVGGAVLIDEEGLVGDAICNRKHHGGEDQAILLEGSLTLSWWAQELGVTLEPGAFGENLVIDGLDNRQVCVGDRFIAGNLVLEATSARIPCATFAAKMGDPRFVKRYTRAGRPGVYCRVLAGGAVEAGLPVEYVPYAGAGVTMPEMMASFGRKLSDEDRARYLAAPIHRKLRAALES